MDGFLRPDTPLLCFYPFPPCCVGGGFLSVRYTFVVLSSLCPLAVSGMIFSLSDTPLLCFVRWVCYVVMGRLILSAKG